MHFFDLVFVFILMITKNMRVISKEEFFLWVWDQLYEDFPLVNSVPFSDFAHSFRINERDFDTTNII